MPASSRFLSRTIAALAFAGSALAVVACSGSNSLTTTSVPTATPARGAACIGSAPVTSTVTFQTGSVQFPTIGGCSATLTFANIIAPVTATVTAQLTAPANYPPAPAAPAGFTGQVATPVVYFVFTLNSALTFTGSTPTIAFTVPAAPTSGSFYNLSADLGPANPPGGIAGGPVSYAGPATVTGNTITFPGSGTGGGSGTLQANETYVISLNYF